MKQIRNQIDGIDTEILKLLKKRMSFVIKLGKLKKKNGMPIADKKREEEMMKKLEKQSKKINLNAEFIKKIYKNIFKESRKAQYNK